VSARLSGRYGRLVPKTRAVRSQQERSEATMDALVAAARELFAQDGYTATSLDAVVAKAGMTKGALYHHFEGKRELFAAVLTGEQEQLTAATLAAYQRKKDPWEAFEAGCLAFLDACLDPGVQRIALLDAPGALGWEQVRELEAGLLDLMELGVQRAIEAGRVAPRQPRPLAQLLFGAVCEGAMVAARAEDQRTAQRAIKAELRRLLHSLAK
jgi:AcrR family transcriptional regulator